MFKWGSRKDEEPDPEPGTEESLETVATSKVMPKFVAALSQQSSPVLLDLGPVVGSNVTFFGDRLACKMYVEDLYADIETHARRAGPDTEPPELAARLTQPPESVDGILCWDVFDYLEPGTSRALAGRLTTLLRRGGALYGLFGTTPIDLVHYTRFVIEEEDTIRYRTSPATPARRTVLLTRDIYKMFSGLEVADSVLLKSSTRETLFRKP